MTVNAKKISLFVLYALALMAFSLFYCPKSHSGAYPARNVPAIPIETQGDVFADSLNQGTSMESTLGREILVGDTDVLSAE